MESEFHFEIVHAREHRPKQYQDYIDGQRALKIVDKNGRERAELVWRLATGHTVEITEFGIYNPNDRRHGLGAKLLKAALEEMRSFLEKQGKALRCVYLFCEETNKIARTFYEKQGFTLGAVLKNFYHDGDAALYVLLLEEVK